MDLLRTIIESQGRGFAQQIANQLGVAPSDAENVIGQITPALGRGLARNSGSAGGLGALLGALETGNHARYLEDPSLAVARSGVDEGNKILGHILGSKDVSRQLASRASEQTGVDGSLIKKMLPMIATMAMGALSNKNAESAGTGDGLGGVLGAFLGADNDNSMVDDLLGMAGKLFSK